MTQTITFTRDGDYVVDNNGNRYRVDYEYDFEHNGTHHVVVFDDRDRVCIDYSTAYFDDDALFDAYVDYDDPFYDENDE